MKRCLALLLTLFASCAHAQIAFDAASSDTNSGGDELTVSHTASGSDGYVLIGIFADGEPTITSVSYGAQTPSLIHSHSNAGLFLYGLDDPAAGVQTVTVTLAATNARLGMIVLSYSGVGSLGTSAESHVTNGSPLEVTVSSTTGELVVDVAEFSTDAMTVGAGQTSRLELDNLDSAFRSLGMSDEPGAASVTMSWTSAGADGYIIAVPLQPAEGGGGGIVVNPISGRGGAAAQPVITNL